MLTRRSGPARTVFLSLASQALAPLPLSLTLGHIFSRLTLRQRFRLAAVNRAWRAALNEPALWAHLDFLKDQPPWKPTSVTPSRRFFEACTAKAAGQLVSLRMRMGNQDNAVASLAQANALTLTTLDAYCEDAMDVGTCMFGAGTDHKIVAAVLTACPNLAFTGAWRHRESLQR